MADPLILATWSFGRLAVQAGWPHLVRDGGGSLDAVEHACRAVEADPDVRTVGLGGYPDASGEVTLDGCIMRSPAECGSVAFVRGFPHPVTLARRVMERTPHVMLVGEGAERLAREAGLAPADLLTDASRQAWCDWRAEQAARGPDGRRGPRDAADHDTVGVLALGARGDLAGACSTSGLRFKRPGRVGDSPIIGHGLYVHPRDGAAVATGVGELIMGVCGTFLAVEAMRGGASPQEAAEAVVRRVADSYDLRGDDQVGVLTLAPSGDWGSAALRPGFQVAVRSAARDDLVEAGYVLLG